MFSFSGNTPTVMLSWSSFRSPTDRSPAYRRGCRTNRQHIISLLPSRGFPLIFCDLCALSSMRF
jgi:hypothetical protein